MLITAAEAGGTPGFLGEFVAFLVAAALIGYLSSRVRIVPIVGFLLAGVVIGPNALGLVRDLELVNAAAEVGVILLLFAIGIEFSLTRLARILRPILLGGGLQVGLTTLLTVGILSVFGVDWRAAVFTGFLVALSSTAIVLKILGDRGETNRPSGQTALAFLIFQDLAVVLMVLLVPLLGGGGGSTLDLVVALLKAAGIIAVVLLGARRLIPRLLEVVARTCSSEIFLLTLVGLAFGTAYLTSLAGVSVSLGAFLAGLLVSESEHSEHAIGEILPLQILFSATFFISVGMLLDLGFLMRNIPIVLAGIALVLVVKVVASAVAARVVGASLGGAAATALLIAQVGEFSFVLERVGANSGLSPAGLGEEGSQAFIAATVLLMVATPWLGSGGSLLGRRLDARTTARRQGAAVQGAMPSPAEEGATGDYVVISGWGEAAEAVASELSGAGVRFTVITLNPDGAAQAEALGYDVLRGDSTKQHILQAARVPAARMLVIADDGPEMTYRIASIASRIAPDTIVVVRPMGDADVGELAAAGVDKIVEPERASRLQLIRAVMGELVPPQTSRTVVDPSRVLTLNPAPDACPHVEQIRPVLPDAYVCSDCLRVRSTWVHLRACMDCGHVACCDSSPNRHAQAHFHETGHPIMRSVEPGENWGWCFLDKTLLTPVDDPRTPQDLLDEVDVPEVAEAGEK